MVAKSPQQRSDRVPRQFNLQSATLQSAWHQPLQAAAIDKNQYIASIGVLSRNVFDVGQCSVRREHTRSPLHYLRIVSEGPVLAAPPFVFWNRLSQSHRTDLDPYWASLLHRARGSSPQSSSPSSLEPPQKLPPIGSSQSETPGSL